MFIYLITNKNNGKKYVGKTTKTLAERWQSHIETAKDLTNHNHLYNAIRHYGKAAFKIEPIVEVNNIEVLAYLEGVFQIIYKSTDRTLGYNCVLGRGKYEQTSNNNP